MSTAVSQLKRIMTPHLGWRRRDLISYASRSEEINRIQCVLARAHKISETTSRIDRYKSAPVSYFDLSCKF